MAGRPGQAGGVHGVFSITCDSGGRSGRRSRDPRPGHRRSANTRIVQWCDDSPWLVELARFLVELARFLVELARFLVELARFLVELARFLVELARFLVELARFLVELARFL